MTTDEAITLAGIGVDELRHRAEDLRQAPAAREAAAKYAINVDAQADAVQHLIEIARCKDEH